MGAELDGIDGGSDVITITATERGRASVSTPSVRPSPLSLGRDPPSRARLSGRYLDSRTRADE